jgi:hypothetical protein
MASQIHDLLSVILRLCVKSETGHLPPAMLSNIGQFAQHVFPAPNLLPLLMNFRTLQRIHVFVEAQQSPSKIKRFFRHSENTAQLEECKTALRHALDIFGVCSLP